MAGAEHAINENDIAVIGTAGRFPGSGDIAQYWQNLRDGVECIRPLSEEELLAAGVPEAQLRNPYYVKAGGVLSDFDGFDAGLFGFSPKDAAILDPQHRVFFECAWEALENAGHTSEQFGGAVGVFAGCGMNSYFMRNILTRPDVVDSVGLFLLRHTGNDRDFLPTGVSYKLDLRGPSVAVQTACSTSLVAIHMACQSLLAGECDMALAGGVTIDVPHGQGYLYRENEVQSPDGHCRAFDARAAGTVLTSGSGVVVLRRLADALADGDVIHAVIKGSAINNDGAGKVGYLAPSVDGHAKVVVEALELAGLTADDISYVEAHGTGTLVGDPIEIAALTQAFGQTSDRRRFCRIGSVKTNIGHLDTAAGVASLIKVVESLRHRQIPPSLNFTTPNPRIDFENSPFVVNSELSDWQAGEQPLRAGISSLGVGGTNVHVVVEEAPEPAVSSPGKPWQLLALSAKTPTALDAATARLADRLEECSESNLADVSHTLQVGRKAFEHRRIVACRDREDAIELLRMTDPGRVFTARSESAAPSIVFMFPGGGTQYPNMGRELYDTEPVYQEAVDEGLRIVKPLLDFDLKNLMFPEASEVDRAARKLEQVTASICATFITEYATARLWTSWGIVPAAMTGHSLGEYTAATLAGVMSLEDALAIVALRGRLVERVEGAAMLSVPLPEDELRPLLGDQLDLAAVNAPQFCLVSGMSEPLETLERQLAERDIQCRRLRVGGASHCRLLDPILDEFRAGLAKIQLHPPQAPYISNVTGDWVRPERAQDPEWWVRHFRHTVRFGQGLARLLEDENRILLEVGPGRTLSSLARQQKAKPRAVLTSLRHPDDEVSDRQHVMTTVGRLWLAGMKLDWRTIRGEEGRRRIELPTYPFERQRYWIEPGTAAAATAEESHALVRHAELADWFYRPVWREAPRIDSHATAEKSNGEPLRWLVFLDSSGIGGELVRRLSAAGHEVITCREGDAFYRFSDTEFALSPEEGRAGYDGLFQELAAAGRLPHRIVHLWMVTADESFRPGSSFFHRNQERGFYSLLFLAQALGEHDLPPAMHVTVASNGMQSVDGEPLPYPEKATLLGPVKVIPRELRGVTCKSIDVQLPLAAPGKRRRKPAVDIAPVVAGLWTELTSKPENGVVAMRGDRRFQAEYEPTKISTDEATPARLRPRGVYLITGGLGGIGLAMADHLARNYQARLVLTGRTALPTPERWDAWLSEHSDRDPTSRKIRSLRQLESHGAEVVALAADVANVGDMQHVLEVARERFGSIQGVIHAAGAMDDGLIQLKSADSVEGVFTPKVHGTLLLSRLLADEPLDFFVLFSSSSTALGPAGQVDYTAANCFLNAFAQSRHGKKPHTVAVNWGVWKEVGRAIEISRHVQGESIDESRERRIVAQPLLDECLQQGPDRFLFATDYDAREHWLLDEHRTKSGQALIPGTGYLEIVREAMESIAGAADIELNNVTFVSPLMVNDDQRREARLELTRENGRYAFTVTSRIDGRPAADDAAWELHAQGTVRPGDFSPTPRLLIREILSRCGGGSAQANGEALSTRQAGLLAFGPRWQALRQMHFGNDEAIALVELPEEYRDDLQQYRLHPAVLDLATGFALPLVEGYENSRDLFVPLSYRKVRIHGPLPAAVYSYVRQDPQNHADNDVALFDVTIADEDGTVLVEVEQFAVKKMAAATFAAPLAAGAGTGGRGAHLSEGERLFLETFDAGISVQEGTTALERILASGAGPDLVVTPLPLAELIRRAGRVEVAEASSGVKFARPNLQSNYVEPRDELERNLAGWWEELLGIDQVGVHDDFFELGGHSLNAVRLFAKIKKSYGIEFPISVLFQAPTVARCADLLREELGDNDSASDAPREKRDPSFRYLVPMNQAEDEGRLPFYLVAGMFGNVLNLRHLAAHLGRSQPVYAVQARGLRGDDTPHRRFEEMAEAYLEEIIRIQPQGPYLLGGFSGGGITAFEMAQQLVSQGEEVGLLVMLDSIPAELPRQIMRGVHLSRRDKLSVHWQRFRQQGVGYFSRWVRDRVEWELQQRRGTAEELTPAEFRSAEIEAAFREALIHYQTSVYDGRLVLFRPPLDERYKLSGGRVLNSAREYVDAENHWSPYVRGGIDVHVVPGDHDSMVLEPNVRVLARELRQLLAGAQVAPIEQPELSSV